MDPVALALVVAAAILHATWNRLLHETDDRVAAMAMAGLIGGVVLLPATLLAPPTKVLALIVLSALVEAAYALCLSAAYRRGALSLAYPIGRGVAPLRRLPCRSWNRSGHPPANRFHSESSRSSLADLRRVSA